VLVVAWSPDAQVIASGDMDGSILLWDPKDGKLLGSCSGHKKWITSLVGDRCCCGSWDLRFDRCLTAV
jgi:WD40 repeat protein